MLSALFAIGLQRVGCPIPSFEYETALRDAISPNNFTFFAMIIKNGAPSDRSAKEKAVILKWAVATHNVQALELTFEEVECAPQDVWINALPGHFFQRESVPDLSVLSASAEDETM